MDKTGIGFRPPPEGVDGFWPPLLVYSFLAKQLCGHVALWLRTYRAMRLYGYVATWLGIDKKLLSACVYIHIYIYIIVSGRGGAQED